MPCPHRWPRRVATALLLVTLSSLAGCSRQETTSSPPRPAMVMQPQAAELSYTVFPGEVRARHETALGFRIGGKLIRREVEVGAQVKRGQVLAELDPGDVRLQADAAGAQLSAAEADLALAESELERHRALLERQLISPSLFEARQTQAQAAKARLNQARAQLDVARNQADYAVLRAPADGVIAQRLAEAGQVVAAGAPVYLLAADGEREVVISLPEAGIERFQPGLAVLLQPWSKPQQSVPGVLRELAPAADAASRTYAARITLQGEAHAFELGQSARAIFAHNGGQALAVPLPAVTADAGKHFVWVFDPGSSTVSRREVSIGAFLDESVPVTAGLNAGEWVVAAGVHLLREGQKVLAVDRDNRPLALGAAG